MGDKFFSFQLELKSMIEEYLGEYADKIKNYLNNFYIYNFVYIKKML